VAPSYCFEKATPRLEVSRFCVPTRYDEYEYGPIPSFMTYSSRMVTYNSLKLTQQLAGEVAHHGTHIKRHVSNIRDHYQAFGIIRLIFCWVKCKASCCNSSWILSKLMSAFVFDTIAVLPLSIIVPCRDSVQSDHILH
jgi:hypothetical protein